MKNTRKAITAAVIGGIFVLTTLIIYFFGNTNVQKTTIDTVALFAVLASEIILFGSITFLNLSKSWEDKIFIKAGITTTLIFYWVISTLFAIIARKAYTDNISGFFTVLFILLAVAVSICIVIAVSYQSMSIKNKKTISAGITLKRSEDMAKLLLADISYLSYKDALNKMYEDIKYSDKSEETSQDHDIYDKLSLLSETLRDASDEEKDLINNCIEEIRQIIRQRNLAVRELKRGRI